MKPLGEGQSLHQVGGEGVACLFRRRHHRRQHPHPTDGKSRSWLTAYPTQDDVGGIKDEGFFLGRWLWVRVAWVVLLPLDIAP